MQHGTPSTCQLGKQFRYKGTSCRNIQWCILGAMFSTEACIPQNVETMPQKRFAHLNENIPQNIANSEMATTSTLTTSTMNIQTLVCSGMNMPSPTSKTLITHSREIVQHTKKMCLSSNNLKSSISDFVMPTVQELEKDQKTLNATNKAEVI